MGDGAGADPTTQAATQPASRPGGRRGFDPFAARALEFATKEGAILIVFGYFTMRGSLLALGVATGLYAIDGVLTVASGSYQGIVIRLLILYFLVQGLMALRELKRRESMGTS